MYYCLTSLAVWPSKARSTTAGVSPYTVDACTAVLARAAAALIISWMIKINIR